MTSVTTRVAALGTLIGDRWPNGTEARLCAELARTLPRSLAHMVAMTADGYPTSTPGAEDRGTGGGGPHDKLGAIVARREHATTSYAALCARIGDASACVALVDRKGVKDALRAAQRLVDEWQPPVVIQYASVRCSSPAEDHLEPWYRADCENIAAVGRQGRCDACSMRRHRWLKTQEGQVAS